MLALTFMVGAKHKLNERLREVPGVTGRVVCSTIDSFAWRLTRRWRGLLGALGLERTAEGDYDGQCAAAATLLERPEVRCWVAVSFPIVVVDEAQDLKPERLRIVVALSDATELLVAADEFQCLDPSLRPNPLVGWLHHVCRPRVLDVVHRTRVRGLLDAAAAIRSGNPPRSKGDFRIIASRGPNMAPSLVSNAIGWGKPVNGTLAVITPARAGDFASAVITRVGERRNGKGFGPYPIRWERSEKEELDRVLKAITLDGQVDLERTLAALGAVLPAQTARATMAWVRHQASARGQTSFTRTEVAAAIAREINIRRQRQATSGSRMAAMTVHQAKNREFDGVVVLWPYRLGGDAEHKRRLLNNAVTRARSWCTVVVQNEDLLTAPPFT